MDSYRTISAPSSGTFTENRSRFLAFAFPVTTTEDVKIFVEEHQRKYYDARHVCYAYMIGEGRTVFRANDNGEPSGTAGKPILGQINSNELTNILIIVVRYFGGVKLGTSGLIQAYRSAAADAIANAIIIEKNIEVKLTLTFDYPLINTVKKILKEFSFPSSHSPSPSVPVNNPPAAAGRFPSPSPLTILSQTFDINCEIQLSVSISLYEPLKSKLQQIHGLTITD